MYFRVPGTVVGEGPYKISSVPATGRYTLILPNGQPARDGMVVEEKDLEGFGGMNEREQKSFTSRTGRNCCLKACDILLPL